MQWYVVVKILLDATTIWPIIEVKKQSTYFLVSSAIFFIQITAAFIFVMTKHPEDCFACFNRMDGSKRNYSQYQYSVEEQDLQRNTYSRMIHEQSFTERDSETMEKRQTLAETKREIDNLLMNSAAKLPDIDGMENDDEFMSERSESVGTNYY